MKKCFPLLALPFLLFCCGKDEPLVVDPTQDICLTEFEIVQSDKSCDNQLINQGCEVIELGSKSLAETAKADFVDFCSGVGTTISFQDADGNTLNSTIQEKAFSTDTYTISSTFTITDSTSCTNYCLSNEEAFIVLASDRFSLRIRLHTGLNFGVNLNNATENITSEFGIWAIKNNTRQIIFQLPIEDFNDEPILQPDTTYIRHHENIVLNNTNYSDLYSNENLDVNGLVRKEKVYFHRKNGLIAVRDSLGVLWTKQ